MDAQQTSRRPSLAADLVGTWELLSRQDVTRSGAPRTEPSLGSDPIALLFFDASGHFAAQFMKRDRSSVAEVETRPSASNNSRARGGYDAYFGAYSVDDETGTVTTRLSAALSQENVGQSFSRTMSVAGNELVIRLDTATASGEPIVRTLRWRRVG